jgi:type IV secretion system protein VirB4
MVSPRGNRLFNLTLGPIAKAFCGSSRPEDQKLMDRLLARDDPASFAARWLEAKRLGAAADALRRQMSRPRLVTAKDERKV